nr:MAG TPA: hypothetical protein [Caudoviricetes sp.]
MLSGAIGKCYNILVKGRGRERVFTPLTADRPAR